MTVKPSFAMETQDGRGKALAMLVLDLSAERRCWHTSLTLSSSFLSLLVFDPRPLEKLDKSLPGVFVASVGTRCSPSPVLLAQQTAPSGAHDFRNSFLVFGDDEFEPLDFSLVLLSFLLPALALEF